MRRRLDWQRRRMIVSLSLGLQGVPLQQDQWTMFQTELAELIPGASGVTVIESLDGHDGFLTEHEQVGAVIRAALA